MQTLQVAAAVVEIIVNIAQWLLQAELQQEKAFDTRMYTFAATCSSTCVQYKAAVQQEVAIRTAHASQHFGLGVRPSMSENAVTGGRVA